MTPSLHTSLLETFKVHLTAVPGGVVAADTTKPKADPKGKLIQALKLPLTVVPKAADDAKDVQDIELSPPPKQHDQAKLEVETSASIVPKPYTPRLLQRLAILQRKSSQEKDDEPPTPQPSPQPVPLTTKLLPHPPDRTPSSESSSVATTSPSQTQSGALSDQQTPQMSPRLSPLTSPPGAQATPGQDSTVESATSSAASKPSGSAPEQGAEGATGSSSKDSSAGGKKSDSAVVRVDSDDEPPPPPPPPPKRDVTVWQLLIKKRYLMKHMTSNFELPSEEDLLDRFQLIDIYSRRIFPTLFFVLFTIYWVLFNYYIEDKFETPEKEIVDGLIS